MAKYEFISSTTEMLFSGDRKNAENGTKLAHEKREKSGQMAKNEHKTLTQKNMTPFMLNGPGTNRHGEESH